MRSALSASLTVFMAASILAGVAHLASLFSPNVPSLSFLYTFITGLVLSLALVFIAVLQVSNVFSREYERRVHELLYISPIDTLSLVVGKSIAALIQVMFLYMPLMGVFAVALWFYLGLSIDAVSMVLLLMAHLATLTSITMTVVLCSLLCRRDLTSVVCSTIALYILMGLGNVESVGYLSPFTFVNRFSLAVLDGSISLVDVGAFVFVCFYIILLVAAMVILLDRRRAYIL
jgi:ABC-type transport system involved in multi-copper enzyme maturation permease subunit